MSDAPLILYTGSLYHRAEAWASLSDEDLRRQAVRACQERDAEALWALTEAHLTLHGKKGMRVSPHTLRNYKREVSALLEAWQGENLLRPSRDAGVLYARKLESEGYKPVTIQVKLAAARGLYKALRWAGATAATPFADVSPAPDTVSAWEKREAYNTLEVELLLIYADSLFDKAVVLLGAHAGLRVSEMARLRWEDVNLKTGKLRVVGKGGKEARVATSKRLRALLEALHAVPRVGLRAAFVLPFGADRARERLKRLCELAEVQYKERAVHGLRHASGTRVYEDTGDIAKVADHLRHGDVKTSMSYAKRHEGATQDVVEEW